jgi:26S proteasome non-ATPase regulatory subunit 9
MELDRVEKLPMAFAKIDVVSDGSPAQSAGLRVGDLVVQFGSVTADNFTTLQALAEVAAHSKDSSLAVRVIRAGAVKAVTLRPRQWSGRGLIGCNIVPILPEAVPDR